MKAFLKYILLLALILVSLSSICKDDEGTGDTLYENVTVAEAFQLIQDNADNPDFVILDVRTPGEFAGGHIESAVNIDFYADSFKTDLNRLDKNKTYLIYCRSGNRSGKTLTMMRELKFRNVYEMKDGIKQWKKESLPIVNET